MVPIENYGARATCKGTFVVQQISLLKLQTCIHYDFGPKAKIAMSVSSYNCWRHVPTHAAAAALVEWALLSDFVQLHVDLFGDDGDRVAAESGHHHGAQVGDVVTLTEGGDTAAHALLRSVGSGGRGGI